MRYFWLVIFVLSVGSVSAQNSARVRELEKQRKAALAEIEMTSQLLDETRQTARNSLCPVPSPYALPSRVCRLAEEAGFRNYR